MAHDVGCPSGNIAREKNIPGTFQDEIPLSADAVNIQENVSPENALKRCGYVRIDHAWRLGDADPFCNGPALPGSSYCAAHRQICAIDARSGEGIERAVELAAAGERLVEPPPELAFLAGPEPPEMTGDGFEDDPVAMHALVDHPAALSARTRRIEGESEQERD